MTTRVCRREMIARTGLGLGTATIASLAATARPPGNSKKLPTSLSATRSTRRTLPRQEAAAGGGLRRGRQGRLSGHRALDRRDPAAHGRGRLAGRPEEAGRRPRADGDRRHRLHRLDQRRRRQAQSRPGTDAPRDGPGGPDRRLADRRPAAGRLQLRRWIFAASPIATARCSRSAARSASCRSWNCGAGRRRSAA